ncbi:MAG: peroxide stress protein YaaA [bacterium]
MLIVISPAKTLDFESPLRTSRYTEPEFLEHSQALINVMLNYSAMDIAELMKVSMKIAELNFDRFSDWSTPFTPENARQAILAFKGDVYDGLEASSMSEDDFDFAQHHLRMLSGLYGLLKPLDLMQPYRLEMGTRLQNPRGKNLYEFWGSLITERLNDELKNQKEKTLINLASNEYFRAVKPREVEGRVITPHFKDWKNGQYKIISFYAKKARGMMSRYLIDNRLEDSESIKDFGTAGYAYNDELSGENDWVFTRRVED